MMSHVQNQRCSCVPAWSLWIENFSHVNWFLMVQNSTPSPWWYIYVRWAYVGSSRTYNLYIGYLIMPHFSKDILHVVCLVIYSDFSSRPSIYEGTNSIALTSNICHCQLENTWEARISGHLRCKQQNQRVPELIMISDKRLINPTWKSSYEMASKLSLKSFSEPSHMQNTHTGKEFVAWKPLQYLSW